MAKIRINRRKDYKEQLKLYLNLSKSLNAKIKKLFRKTARKAEQEYLKYEDMYYFFLEDFSDDFYKILSKHYRAVITASGERLIKQRETKQESAIDLAVAKYIQDVTANKVADISQTTRNQIKQAIKKGIADGESIPTISKNIRQNNAFQPYRATMIARTETHSAMNYGNHEISKSLDFDKPVKTWNSALDDRTRGWHRAMNGTTVARDEMFKVLTPVAGGAFTERSMSYTGDMNGGALNVINCRCFTLYYDSADDVIGATPEPDSPIVNVEELPPIPEPKTPVGFVGFGRTTDKELEFHNDSWNDSPEKYKQIPAKFKEIKVTTTTAGSYYDNSKININKDRNGYSKSATFRHEYGHHADREMWKTNLNKNTKFGKKIKTIKEADKRNRIDIGSLVYAKEIKKDRDKVKENIKNGSYKYESNLPRKNGLTAMENYQNQKFAQYGYDESTRTFANLKTKEDIQIFLNDVFEDGIFFKKEEIKQLINFDEIAGGTFELDISSVRQAVRYQMANKMGLIDSASSIGIFKSLNGFIMRRSTREVTLNASRDIGMLTDYMGAITTNKFGYGHDTNYYLKTQAKVRIGRESVSSNSSAEAFAQYISLSSSPQSQLWRIKMTEFAPNTKNGFDEMVDEILKMDNLD